MKLTSLSVFLLILLTNGISQDSSNYFNKKNNYKYSEGYIVTKDSTRIEGLIKNEQFFEVNRFRFVTIIAKDGNKFSFFPSEVIEYGYSNYKFVSDDSKFYQIVKTGNKVSLYRNLYQNPYNPSVGGSEIFYVKKTNESVYKMVKKNKFKVEFAEYFGDCESLKLKIQNKELTHKNIVEIVSKYNWCQ